MSSRITIRSKWRDTTWVPEPGSKLGPAYVYTLGTETHYLSREEQQAGERMGCQSYIDYAFGVPQSMQHITAGWEYFDQRPGIRNPNLSDWEYLANGNRRWTEQDLKELIRLRRSKCSWLECAMVLGRGMEACKAKWRDFHFAR